MEYNISKKNKYLCHYGVSGMKWGIRRYQNKDGTLTDAGRKRYDDALNTINGNSNSSMSKRTAKKTIKKLGTAVTKNGEQIQESDSEKRDRILKSTNPKEIYENRHLLSTNEINERINRIDTEARLKSKIVEENQITGMEYVNSKIKRASDNINNATSLFKSVDNAYNSVMNSGIGKTLSKKLGLEPPKKEFNLNDFLKDINKKTTQEVLDANKRVTAEESLRKRAESINNEKKTKNDSYEKAKKEVEKYVNSGYKNDRVSSSTYSKKRDEMTDNKVSTGKGSTNKPMIEQIDMYEAEGKDVFGEGTSRFNGWNDSPVVDSVYDGQRYVNSLLALEDKSRR